MIVLSTLTVHLHLKRFDYSSETFAVREEGSKIKKIKKAKQVK